MEFIQENLCLEDPPSPKNPKDGVFIEYQGEYFVSLYNCIIDTYGIYKVDQNWSHYYWCPPESYISPIIQWELIWKEMDYCLYGFIRKYLYSETKYGPEIHFVSSRL
tara:strand:- start:504 stop:824 length:321 start_codon:yes stop_codon:yes gene_type:complete